MQKVSGSTFFNFNIQQALKILFIFPRERDRIGYTFPMFRPNFVKLISIGLKL